MLTKINILKNCCLNVGYTFSKRFLAPTSLKPRREGNHYRLWAMPGDEILAKEILAKQYTFKWHPGLNVGIDRCRTLYALCDGVMIITEEKFEPDFDHPLVNKIFESSGERRVPEYARYIHVIPKHRISEFKLVDVI